MEEIKTKVCTKCHVKKPIDQFCLNKECRDDYGSHCKECHYKLYHHKKVKEEVVLEFGFKMCTKCHQIKSFDKFHKQKTGKFGLRPWCIECDKEYFKKNIEHKKEVKRKYRAKNPLRQLLQTCTGRARQNGILYDSTDILEDYFRPLYDKGLCEFCGCELKNGYGQGKMNPNSPSIDRIIPTEGYVVGNVALLCQKCNTKKQDNTLEDFKSWVQWIEFKTSNNENNPLKEVT